MFRWAAVAAMLVTPSIPLRPPAATMAAVNEIAATLAVVVPLIFVLVKIVSMHVLLLLVAVAPMVPITRKVCMVVVSLAVHLQKATALEALVVHKPGYLILPGRQLINQKILHLNQTLMLALDSVVME